MDWLIISNNAAVRRNNKTVFTVWSVSTCYEQGTKLDVSWVLHERLWRQDLSAWSWRISTIRSRCQGTSGGDIASWK
jgi:uncharacterized membrane protein